MFSASRRTVVTRLLAHAVVAVLGLPWAGAADEKGEKPLSPETILENKFEGQATVELQVGEVATLNIDSLSAPDVSYVQVVKAEIPGAQIGQEFWVSVSRETATQLLMLGIEDPAGHFLGKTLRVSGVVERVKQPDPPAAIIYRISVTNLEQFESIRKSLALSEKAELVKVIAKEAGGALGNGGDRKVKTARSSRTQGTLIATEIPKGAAKDELTLDGGYVETGMNEVSIISTVDDPPGLRLGVMREKGWGRSLGKFSFNSVRPDRVQDECVLIQGKLDERYPLAELVGEYIFFLRTPPGGGDEGDMVQVLTLQHDRIVAHVPVVCEQGVEPIPAPGVRP